MTSRSLRHDSLGPPPLICRLTALRVSPVYHLAHPFGAFRGFVEAWRLPPSRLESIAPGLVWRNGQRRDSTVQRQAHGDERRRADTVLPRNHVTAKSNDSGRLESGIGVMGTRPCTRAAGPRHGAAVESPCRRPLREHVRVLRRPARDRRVRLFEPDIERRKSLCDKEKAVRRSRRTARFGRWSGRPDKLPTAPVAVRRFVAPFSGFPQPHLLTAARLRRGPVALAAFGS